jgi:glycosyltransferase involved in cell wall biosynthesis
MGHDVHIVYSKEGYQRPELPGVVLHQLKARSNYDLYLLWQLVRLICGIKPDIIQTWVLQMDILGGMAARLRHIPWIFREPSSAMAYVSNWKHRLRVKVGSGAIAIVSNSRGGDEYWKTNQPNSRRYIVPNALPVQEIERVISDLPPGLAKSEVPIVLYVGRLASSKSARKNLKYLFEALAYIMKKREVLGVICGDGPQRSELETLRHKLGLDECIKFTGYLPSASVWALMKKASVFVSLSAYEGCPNTVMEAMACGCPLVLSDIQAHREILDQSCALFVKASDIQQISESIVHAVSNADTSRARALMAKQRTREWAIAIIARKWENIYKDLL